jgi:hypothetical protein
MRVLPALLFLAAVAGCGGEDTSYENRPRPAAPITITAAILEDEVLVSPTRFGAGPIEVIISNQSAAPRRLTFETDEVGGESGGLRRATETIAPRRTGTLKLDPREGTYRVSAGDGVESAAVLVGRPRPSAQNELLQP